jgi:hypothetical protein
MLQADGWPQVFGEMGERESCKQKQVSHLPEGIVQQDIHALNRFQSIRCNCYARALKGQSLTQKSPAVSA